MNFPALTHFAGSWDSKRKMARVEAAPTAGLVWRGERPAGEPGVELLVGPGQIGLVGGDENGVQLVDPLSYFLIRLPVHSKEKLAPSQQDDAGQVTPQVEALLRVIYTELSRDDLQARLGLADRENFRLLYLLPKLNAKLIERTIPDKPNSRLQKYRLNAKGRVLLDQQ
jgi:hypothetical protein